MLQNESDWPEMWKSCLKVCYLSLEFQDVIKKKIQTNDKMKKWLCNLADIIIQIASPCLFVFSFFSFCLENPLLEDGFELGPVYKE